MQLSLIKIVPNRKKAWAVKLAGEVKRFLSAKGFKISEKSAHATICIGGDGTIFYANHMNRLSGAVLGIGSGSSVVCRLRKSNWKKRILAMLKRNNARKRLTLAAVVGKRKINSVNDIVVHSNDYRMIRVFLKIGNKNHVFDGDGMIISTPTGSTGYAYSAGGKILPLNSKKIELVPICPYKRAFQTSTAGENTEISMSCDRSSSLIIDGIFIRKLKHGEMVKVKKDKALVFLE